MGGAVRTVRRAFAPDAFGDVQAYALERMASVFRGFSLAADVTFPL
jgi:hypothetical protein